MELESANIEAKTKYVAHETFTINSNHHLKIDGDSTILKEKVPNGKQWSVDVHVSITETDEE